ncbi:MAG: M20 family metallopeptidase [Lachnospiraceae bacterium]|nr:M20 family metallopeptidase [Lachnospiraceae bacterium]
MTYFEKALTLNDTIIKDRRWFHTNAEVGLHMPKAQTYVLSRLSEMGIVGRPCGGGVVAEIGSGDRVLLLRADMDALPMPEESGEPFACPTGTEAHTCGHDFHAAMLLSAASMLKANEANLKGRVRFMFQPAEETFEGAKAMMADGLFDNGKPDAAMALHVTAGRMPTGLVMYNAGQTMMFSADGFRLTIKGKGSHGAYPHLSVDPINIGVHIHLALQELIAREADPTKSAILTIGKFEAGAAANIIPDTAILEGTLRTNDAKVRSLLVRRIKEVAEGTAALFGGSVELTVLSDVPPLLCDKTLTDKMVGFIKELPIPNLNFLPEVSSSASEDFAFIAEQIPAVFMYVSAGFTDERGDASAHNPKVRFNEGVCPIGAAALAHCAERYLES